MQATALRSLKNAFSLLSDRSVLRLEGIDAFKFLQGLTTNDLSLLHRKPNTSIYSNILNVQGRVAFDCLISPAPDAPLSPPPSASNTTPTHHSYLLDCAASAADEMQQHFQKYKLRNKIKITNISDTHKVWSVFGKSVTSETLPNIKKGFSELSVQPEEGAPAPATAVTGIVGDWWKGMKDGLCVMDPRYEKLGARLILPTSLNSLQLPTTFTEVPNNVYNMYRLQWGVPQGPEELLRDSQLPLECNTELLNGVHFHKGCYIGQELVARTHYSGLIRKRLLPVVMLDSQSKLPSKEDFEYTDNLFPPIIVDNLAASIPPIGSTLSVGDANSQGTVSASRDRKAGKVIAGVQNVALAMIRLENLNLENLTTTEVKDENGRRGVILTPCWWLREVDHIKKLQRNL